VRPHRLVGTEKKTYSATAKKGVEAKTIELSKAPQILAFVDLFRPTHHARTPTIRRLSRIHAIRRLRRLTPNYADTPITPAIRDYAIPPGSPDTPARRINAGTPSTPTTRHRRYGPITPITRYRPIRPIRADTPIRRVYRYATARRLRDTPIRRNADHAPSTRSPRISDSLKKLTLSHVSPKP